MFVGVLPRFTLYALGAVCFALLALSARADGLFCDRPLIDSSRAIAGPTLTAIVVAITTLGNAPVLTGIVIVAAATLFLLRQPRSALFVLVTGIAASTLNDLLKLAFARPRPDEVLRLAQASGYSFPSGHAMSGAAIYGAIAIVLASFFPRLRLAIAVTTASLVFAVGASRVYLCVHYSSDVMAGWLLGAALPFWILALFGSRVRN